MKSLTIIFLVIFISLQVNAKVYKKCEFARAMKNAGFPRSDLPDWVCLVKHESHFDTQAMNKDNSDRSWDWGIFQINDRYWCKGSYPGGSCLQYGLQQ